MDKFEIRPLTQKWFTEATPKNYKDASTTIGAGANGVITVYSLNDISIANSIEVVAGVGNSVALSVAFANKTLTVTLGTTSGGLVDATKNTAILITSAIDALTMFSATFSGTGETAIGTAVTKKVFTVGQLGTPCNTVGATLLNGSTYYICIEANNSTKNVGWRTFSLTNY